MQRIRLRFSRNQDPDTVAYKVYRQAGGPVTEQSPLIMIIEQPASPQILTVKDEVLTRIGPGRYRARHKHWLPHPPETIYIDGQPAAVPYTLDAAEGVVRFEEAISPYSVVTTDYAFDGIEVWDDEREQDGVTFFGPYAYDQAVPEAPANLKLEAEDANHRVVLTWDAPVSQGSTFHYRIQAVDAQGRASRLSEEAAATVSENLDDVPFLVERSYDGGQTWAQMSRTNRTIIIDYYAGMALPSVLRDVDVTVEPDSAAKTVDVVFHWTSPTQELMDTPMYRVRALNKGQIPGPYSSPVGPIQAPVYLSSIVVRRKPWDGTYPSFAGPDAETVDTLSPFSSGKRDAGLPDQSHWAYAIYPVSQGRAGDPYKIQVIVGDVTAADPGIIVHIEP